MSGNLDARGMTFSISVSGNHRKNEATGKNDDVDARVVTQAVQRLRQDLGRAGLDVGSVSVSGIDGVDHKTFATGEAKEVLPGSDLGVMTNEPGQPGAKNALEMSIEAGTTRTEDQPEPLPTDRRGTVRRVEENPAPAPKAKVASTPDATRVKAAADAKEESGKAKKTDK